MLLHCGADTHAQRRGQVEAENKTLTTRDGVELAITYYPSTLGKEAAPVVILHDTKETRQRYADLAKALSRNGESPLAVLTVDLRGHGESVRQAYGNRERELNASKLRAADYAAMVKWDMGAVRQFLVEENDAGKLNLNRMSMVGVGLGAAVALNYTAFDWSLKDLPTVKQSKDVKTLVLVSPRWKEQLPVQNAVRQPGLQSVVSVLMLYGEEDRRVAADIRRIERQLERRREDTNNSRDKLKPLMSVGASSELQGAEWLRQAGATGENLIRDYLTKYSVEPDYPYSIRKPQF